MLMKRLSGFGIVFACAFLTACGAAALDPAAQQAPPLHSEVHVRSAGISPDKYKLIYTFKGTPDGASPYAALFAVNDTLYGTTSNGSSNYCAQSCGSNDCYLGCG